MNGQSQDHEPTVTAVSSGWQLWEAGDCPVWEDTLVDLCFDDPPFYDDPSLVFYGERAGDWIWSERAETPIAQWRLTTSSEEQSVSPNDVSAGNPATDSVNTSVEAGSEADLPSKVFAAIGTERILRQAAEAKLAEMVPHLQRDRDALLEALKGLLWSAEQLPGPGVFSIDRYREAARAAIAAAEGPSQ